MPSFAEYSDSHGPALRFLRRLGYQWLSREEAVRQRGGLLSQVVLEEVLRERLKAINRFSYKGQEYPFSPQSINAAIMALQRVPDEGLVQTNEKVYDLLTLGKSFTEHVAGDQKAFTLRYIDWEKPERNVYHITDEYIVEGVHATRRPDLVLFVNGIPFCVIQCKRRDQEDSTDEAVSQHIRDQQREHGVPRLYHYAQLLIAAQPNEVRYACTGTLPKFWSAWKENVERNVTDLLAKPHEDLAREDRLPTEQDRALYALCRPERLMDLAYRFSVFDAGVRKVARYQQYFAVQDTLERVRQLDANGKRRGGVIWHTQGSGKSLTMVMLSKALALDKAIADPRVVLVTDRVDLDRQIH
ncbi:MAG: type I restriction endonuclease subunit R, partial [Flavobacteriales bacterium]|nr:type I restriction endonuclease subunit R [Flavobacteriales bacterium]